MRTRRASKLSGSPPSRSRPAPSRWLRWPSRHAACSACVSRAVRLPPAPDPAVTGPPDRGTLVRRRPGGSCEHASRNRSSPSADAPSDALRTRARARAAQGARRGRLGGAPVIPDHAAPAAWAGLLVAVLGAAAVRDPCRRPLPLRRLARRGCRPGGGGTVIAAVMPPAEHVHWWFATGFLILGLCLLARTIVGPDVWDRRPWRRYLFPGLLFVMGLWMWPVMVFFTNSTVHMIAHGVWAQAMMLAGGATLGLAAGKLRNPLWYLTVPLCFVVSGIAFLVHEQNGWLYSRSAFDHHLLGW